MGRVTADDVRAALRVFDKTLRPVGGHDWGVRAGGLEWTVDTVVNHLTDVCVFFAAHLAARSSRRLHFDVRPPVTASNLERLDAMLAAGALLAVTIDTAPAYARGWHFHGVTDKTGFAAMACDELLVHGWDAACGLKVPMTVQSDLCRRVLARVFPEISATADPWPTLLWANGRIDLPGRPHRAAAWRFHSAPLDKYACGESAAG